MPFFVFGETAYATGVGEELIACPQPERHYLLIAPGVAIPTPRVFTDPGLTRDTKPLKIDGLLQGRSVFCGRNDLEPVVTGFSTQVSDALAVLRDTAIRLEIDPDLARMSGSGSSVFLPVPKDRVDSAVQLARSLARLRENATVHVVRSVAKHPLRDWAFA